MEEANAYLPASPYDFRFLMPCLRTQPDCREARVYRTIHMPNGLVLDE